MELPRSSFHGFHWWFGDPCTMNLYSISMFIMNWFSQFLPGFGLLKGSENKYRNALISWLSSRLGRQSEAMSVLLIHSCRLLCSLRYRALHFFSGFCDVKDFRLYDEHQTSTYWIWQPICVVYFSEALAAPIKLKLGGLDQSLWLANQK
jgi:hypothetical protein